MKKLVAVILVLLLVSPALFAQDSLKDIVKEYQKNNADYTFVIPSFLFKVGLAFGEMEDEDRELLELIDDMKIVICQNHFQKNDFLSLEEGIKNGKFAEVMTVNDSDGKVRMIINQKLKNKSEMLMVIESDDENILMLFNYHGEADFKKFLSLVD